MNLKQIRNRTKFYSGGGSDAKIILFVFTRHEFVITDEAVFILVHHIHHGIDGFRDLFVSVHFSFRFFLSIFSFFFWRRLNKICFWLESKQVYRSEEKLKARWRLSNAKIRVNYRKYSNEHKFEGKIGKKENNFLDLNFA